jgi:hypothetical protein
MGSIGIEVECSINFPWIYIDKINNKRVVEVFRSENSFTLMFATEGKLLDIKEIFNLLRKYTKESMAIKE